MLESQEKMPPMPEVGRPESHYAIMVRQAEREGNSYAREAAKVGQYLTLAMDPNLRWEAKLRYFQHALTSHCVAPPIPSEAEWLFYQQLAVLVKQYAGQEALRLASAEDDLYAMRRKLGHSLDEIKKDAVIFFPRLICQEDRCPIWYELEDWKMLKMIRDQWV